MKKLLNMREVGERLGHSYHWFRKRRRAMERDQHFPGPITTCGLRWDPRAIDEWVAAQGQTATPHLDGGDGPRNFAAELDARAEEIAARH